MIDMLTLKPEAFGIDISDLSLKIVKLKRKKNFFDLVSFGEMEIPANIISGGEIKDEKALAKIIKESLNNVNGEKLKTKYVIASLPEEKSFLQVIQLPKIKEEEVKKAIPFEAENYVPLPVDQVYLDFQMIPPWHENQEHLDVLIAALPKKTVDPYLSSLKEAGLKPLAFEIESQAIIRSLVKNNVSSLPVLVIDFGATRTGFIIFSGNSLRFTTSIPVSSRGFTEAISKNLEVDFISAEKLKRKYGLGEKVESKEYKTDVLTIKKSRIFEFLIPILTDFTEQIKKYLNYYQTHAFHEHYSKNGNIVTKIIISGGGANLRGLANFLSSELKIPVELANPWLNIFPPVAKKAPKLPFDKSLSFTTALGLALRG